MTKHSCANPSFTGHLVDCESRLVDRLVDSRLVGRLVDSRL